ncbi:MAG TPA: hypothetical protein VN783_03960, partial [Thermoanaerobaculia bacterium]|nr:hypothetical protein [Thermoanaerobaculia bacterium]
MGVFVSPPNPAASRSGPAHGKPSRTAATAGPREESAPSGAEADLDRAERYGHALEALPAAEAPIQRVLVIKGQGSHSSITKRTPGLAAALKAHPAEKHDQIVSALHDLAQSDKTHKLGGFPAAIDRALSARSSAKKKQGTKVKRNRQLRGPVVAPLALPQPVADESSSESESESDNEKEAVAEESGNESSGSLDVQVGSDSERKIGSDSERKVRSDDERKVRSDDERSDSERKSEASSSDEESDFSAAEDAPGVKAAIQDKGLQFGEDGSLLDKDGQPLSKNARKGVYQKLGLTHTLTGHG